MKKMKTMKTITIKQKRNFLRWVVQHHEFKLSESIWLFNYLAAHEHMLKNVVFVENGKDETKCIKIATKRTPGEGMVYLESGKVIETEPDEVFQKMRRLVRDGKVAIEVTFQKTPLQYLEVLEEKGIEGISQEVEVLVARLLREREQKILMKQIDDALDEWDQETFYDLTKKLTASQ